MKNLRLWSLLAVLVPPSAFGQSLAQIQWQQSFGGTGPDSLRSIREVPNQGYLLCGFSGSDADGNKTTANLGAWDYWLVRVDGEGQKIWEAVFGGSQYDMAYSAATTRDGGFIIGGESSSGIDGNKESPNHGGSDYWALGLDELGNKVWETSLGGSQNDILSSVQQTSDGGFVLAGWSYSSAEGTKTSTNFGGADVWVVRLDHAGRKLWDRSYGGGGVETNVTIAVTLDSGFIFSATSRSGASGNKTNEASGVWVVRLDDDGNKLWERIIISYGNTVSATVEPLPNGDFLVGSSVSFDCCGGVPCACMDFYMTRLDGDGNGVWSAYQRGPQDGGVENPVLVALRPTPDGGFVAGSRIGDYSVHSRYHISRLDASGRFIWAQGFGPYGGFQSLFCVEITQDGGVIFGGHSGQPPGENKTSPNYGSLDFWVLKLLPEQPHLALLPLEPAQKAHFLLRTSYLGTYVIERSTDLLDWLDWQTNLFNFTAPEIVDYETNITSTLFYRARRLR